MSTAVSSWGKTRATWVKRKCRLPVYKLLHVQQQNFHNCSCGEKNGVLAKYFAMINFTHTTTLRAYTRFQTVFLHRRNMQFFEWKEHKKFAMDFILHKSLCTCEMCFVS